MSPWGGVTFVGAWIRDNDPRLSQGLAFIRVVKAETQVQFLRGAWDHTQFRDVQPERSVARVLEAAVGALAHDHEGHT